MEHIGPESLVVVLVFFFNRVVFVLWYTLYIFTSE